MKGRLVFVDLLRGWATIVMIEVHVFNAFLVGPIKAASWYGWVNYVNGLVAPSFLFVAGFVFVIASDRKLEEFRTLGRAFWRQLGRIVLIWVIGYSLHLPFFSLTRTIRDTPPEKWLESFQSDILHCIAIGMLIVFLGRIFIKRDRYFEWFIAAVGSVTVLAAPLIWDIDFTTVLPGVFAVVLQWSALFDLSAVSVVGFFDVRGRDGICVQERKSDGQGGRVFSAFDHHRGSALGRRVVDFRGSSAGAGRVHCDPGEPALLCLKARHCFAVAHCVLVLRNVGRRNDPSSSM